MDQYSEAINRHYGEADVSSRILTALQDAGKDINALTRDDLTFDQFHTGGRAATGQLAQLAGLRQGMHVLDVGSGVGGPARTLAAEFGCRVTGLDLTEEFCKAADMLTARLGLDKEVAFRHGSALEMPFEDNSFDAVWTQNTLMNIEDKERLFNEVHRVLKPGGLFALQSLMEGPTPGVIFPTMWADDPSLNFLVTPEAFRELLLSSGFLELAWQDITPRSPAPAAAPTSEPPPLDFSVIGVSNYPEKSCNSGRNHQEGRVVAIQAVVRSSSES